MGIAQSGTRSPMPWGFKARLVWCGAERQAWHGSVTLLCGLQVGSTRPNKSRELLRGVHLGAGGELSSDGRAPSASHVRRPATVMAARMPQRFVFDPPCALAHVEPATALGTRIARVALWGTHRCTPPIHAHAAGDHAVPLGADGGRPFVPLPRAARSQPPPAHGAFFSKRRAAWLRGQKPTTAHGTPGLRVSRACRRR